MSMNVNSRKNIIICCSHNNRIELFFKKINKNNNNYTNKSFNNCSVIKCYKKNNYVNFMMIYAGESYNDTVSVCTISSGCWDIDSFNKFFNKYSYKINIPDNTEIYLIRHALGVHNKMNVLQKIFNFKKDSELDIIGIEQAKRLGNFLKTYIKNNYTNPNLYFSASHLVRTQQTIGIIMNKMNINKKIYIVPCIHEINIASDAFILSLFQYIPIASNIPRCRNDSNMCNKLDVVNNNYNIDWAYYMKHNKRCNNDDMISTIIKTVFN